MADQKSLIELRKEAKAKGVEDVNKKTRTQLEADIKSAPKKEQEQEEQEQEEQEQEVPKTEAPKQTDAVATTPELAALRDYAKDMEIEGAETMSLDELEEAVADKIQEVEAQQDQDKAEEQKKKEELARQAEETRKAKQAQTQSEKKKEHARRIVLAAKKERLTKEISDLQTQLEELKVERSRVSQALVENQSDVSLTQQLQTQKELFTKGRDQEREKLLAELAKLTK